MQILKLNAENRPLYLAQALALHRRLLGRLSRRRLVERLRGRKPLLLVAVEGDRVVGYKFGYEERPGRFYSWLGGVEPEFRRRGIASALMHRQHRLLEKAGYREVRCHTRNRFRGMLLLSIMHGFDIIGTVWGGGEIRLVLSKKLGRKAKDVSEGL